MLEEEFVLDEPTRLISNEQLQHYEKMIIAIAINSSKACFEITSKLEKIDFYSLPNQMLFETITELSTQGKNINVATIIEKLKEEKKLEAIGGIPYITDVLNYYYTDEGFEEYIGIIFKYSLSRRLENALVKIKNEKDVSPDIMTTVMHAQELILNIKTDVTKDDAEEIRTVVDKVLETTIALMNNDNKLTGVSTGFEEINNLTFGWQKGDFIILAARPSMGKTALALNLAVNAAKDYKNVAFFSLEMPKEQLVQRVLSAYSRVDSTKIRTGANLSQDDISKLTICAESIKNLEIVIDDTPGLNILQLQSKIRKLQRDYKIDICFIDYLQLISGLPNKNENRSNEIATISRQIKKIARELEMPIICLSQLSRSVESREEKRPLMSDLRDSGAIEQDADIITFIYRKSYYDRKDVAEISDVEETEVIFAKHRNGAIGTIDLNFYKNIGRFKDKKS